LRICSPYEPPENAEVTIGTVATAAEDAAGLIVAQLQRMGVLDLP
jgi:adenylylsulfate kinase-like enzyme